MIKYEDIHLSDKDKRKSFMMAINDGEYDNAHQIVIGDDMKLKCTIANTVNTLTSDIEATENLNDISFKSDRIIVSMVAPSIKTGQVYFEVME